MKSRKRSTARMRSVRLSSTPWSISASGIVRGMVRTQRNPEMSRISRRCMRCYHLAVDETITCRLQSTSEVPLSGDARPRAKCRGGFDIALRSINRTRCGHPREAVSRSAALCRMPRGDVAPASGGRAMVEQGRSGGRAEAWRPWIAAGRRPAPAWPQSLRDFARRAAQRVREWATAEVAPGRLVPWLAIAFRCGTIIYFAGERDPAPRAAALLLAVTVAAAILCRHRPFALPATVGIAAVAAGFATASIKREIIAHPVLAAPVWNVELAGFVEVREERQRSDRIVVLLEPVDSARLNERPAHRPLSWR